MPRDGNEINTDSTARRLEYALWFAKQGFPIIQLQAGAKEPTKGKWSEASTTDEETIRMWFKYNPEMNYGVTGGEHHAIVDLDIKEGINGANILAEIAQRFGDEFCEYSQTLTSQSPSGGRHLFYKVDKAVSNANRFPDGIDVRGQMGYVVGPGCDLVEGMCKAKDTPGAYKIVERNGGKIAAAPHWMVDHFQSHDSRGEDADTALYEWDLPINIESARRYLKNRAPAIEGQGGNEQTLTTFMKLRDFGISKEKAVELVMEEGGWNERCEPEWDHDELTAPAGPATNAYKYARQQPGIQGMDDNPFGMEGLTQEEIEAEGYEDAERQKKKADSIESLIFTGGAMFQRGKRREMIIPGWVPAHGVTGVLAARGTGKTAVMLDMALRISLDRDWHGNRVAPDWHVVYFCGEDDEGAEENARAWCNVHGVDEPPERFHFVDGIVNLLDAENVRAWSLALRKRLPEGARAVLFLDTWQRASGRGSQNDDYQMTTAVTHLEQMAEALRGPAVAAFHSPKSENKPGKTNDNLTILGSSVIENMTSAILTLSNEPGSMKKLEVTRQKGKGEGYFNWFRFEEIETSEQIDPLSREKPSGVVAIRIGGTKAETLRADHRACMARVIRELEKYRKTENAEADFYTTKVLAERIARLKSEEYEGDAEQAKWASELMNELRRHGMGNSNADDLCWDINCLFREDGRPFDFGDGKVLHAIKKGDGFVFKVERGGVGVIDPKQASLASLILGVLPELADPSPTAIAKKLVGAEYETGDGPSELPGKDRTQDILEEAFGKDEPHRLPDGRNLVRRRAAKRNGWVFKLEAADGADNIDFGPN